MNFKAKIHKVQIEEVNIDEQQMFEIAIEVLSNKFDIPSCRPAIDDDGNLTSEYEQCGGSHCWFTTDVIRKATKLDKQVVEILRQLKSHKPR